MRPGTATITQIPKPVECSPMAALIPQAKESGEDSPSLPLIPVHLSPASPAAIYFTGTAGGGWLCDAAGGRKEFVCAVYTKLAIIFHLADAASFHPLSSNVTQPLSPLLVK